MLSEPLFSASAAPHVLLVGASGYVGQSVIRHLQEAGCQLSALARTTAAAEKFQAQGVSPVPGDVGDVAGATDRLADHDACIWLSWLDWEDEAQAVAAVLDAIRGSGKSFIFTSGTGMLGLPALDGAWDERSFAEDDPFTPAPHLIRRAETERKVRAQAEHGVRAMVIRPPLIWGHGGSRQIPLIFDSVRLTGTACYVGAGLHVYSHVHVDDLADVYGRALAHGQAGALYHAVAGEADFRSLAEAVAQAMGCSARSITFDEAVELFGLQMARGTLAVNSRTRSPRTREELGWRPRHADVIEDIRHGSYFRKFTGQD